VHLVSPKGRTECTVGHTLSREVAGEVVPDIVTRGLGDGYQGTAAEASTRTWPIVRGERIIILNRYLARTVGSKEVATVSTRMPIDDLASELANAYPVEPSAPYVAIIAFESS